MKDVFVVFLQDKHLPEAEKLVKDNPDIFNESDVKEFREDLLQYLLDNPHDTSHKKIMVLLAKDTLCGLVMLEKVPDSQAYYRIKWLVVKKEEQHKGYGTLLMKYAFEEIKKLGGEHVYVETSNEKHNEKAKHFYENLHFTKVGVLPNFYSPPLEGRKSSEDRILYSKTL